MAEDWLALQKDIMADLKKDGASFVFTRQVDAKFDPILGAYVGGKEEQFTVYGIFISQSTQPPRAFILQSGTTIEQGDLILLAECASYEARIDDKTVVNGKNYRVAAFTLLNPSGLSLLQYLVLREA